MTIIPFIHPNDLKDATFLFQIDGFKIGPPTKVMILGKEYKIIWMEKSHEACDVLERNTFYAIAAPLTAVASIVASVVLLFACCVTETAAHQDPKVVSQLNRGVISPSRVKAVQKEALSVTPKMYAASIGALSWNFALYDWLKPCQCGTEKKYIILDPLVPYQGNIKFDWERISFYKIGREDISLVEGRYQSCEKTKKMISSIARGNKPSEETFLITTPPSE